MPATIQNQWLWISATDLATELKQIAEEGKDVSPVRRRFDALLQMGDARLFDPQNQSRANELLDITAQLPIRRDFPYHEPSDLAGIRKACHGTWKPAKRLPKKDIADRIHAAWIGRCAGCLLGRPLEGVRTRVFWPFLKKTRQWPLSDYITFPDTAEIKKKFGNSPGYNALDHMPIDDDTNYTTTGLLIMERSGKDFTPADVAQFWLSNIPSLSTCTAERIAYRNFLLHIQPPASAVFRNPYREWIGAQIRADAFGYVNVGNPSRAAEFAWRDACISHCKNGIYGEMFVAAMLAAAPLTDSLRAVIDVGLAHIPARSRLYAAIRQALQWHASGCSYDEAVQMVHERYDEDNWHDWTHTITNAVVCAVALLWSQEDFGTAMCRAVQVGYDTDCNGATVGSIMGMHLGTRGIPSKWSSRLHNTLKTSLQGNNQVTISAMADRTYALHEKFYR